MDPRSGHVETESIRLQVYYKDLDDDGKPLTEKSKQYSFPLLRERVPAVERLRVASLAHGVAYDEVEAVRKEIGTMLREGRFDEAKKRIDDLAGWHKGLPVLEELVESLQIETGKEPE